MNTFAQITVNIDMIYDWFDMEKDANFRNRYNSMKEISMI